MPTLLGEAQCVFVPAAFSAANLGNFLYGLITKSHEGYDHVDFQPYVDRHKFAVVCHARSTQCIQFHLTFWFAT
jgi:hypothetical protein